MTRIKIFRLQRMKMYDAPLKATGALSDRICDSNSSGSPRPYGGNRRIEQCDTQGAFHAFSTWRFDVARAATGPARDDRHASFSGEPVPLLN